MENPSILIAALTSASSLTRDAFRLHRNAHFTSALVTDDGSTRESTPAVDLGESTIFITTNHKPFDPLSGYVFGSADQEEVDIVLGGKEGSGVSRKHFSLRHNWDMEGFFLHNNSKFGTKVMTISSVTKVDSQTLSLASGDVIIAGSAKMRITYPKRKKGSRQENAFRANWQKEYHDWQAAVPHADHLSLGDSMNPTFSTYSGLELLKRIGNGLSSTIWQAKDSFGKMYAVKAPKEERFARNIASEIEALERTQHPNIIAFFRDKVVEQKQLPSPYIVLEYAEYGSLEESWKVMDIKQVEALFTQLFEAVQYSHSIGLAHLDIKPANVLITSTYPFWVKLADFGFAQFGPWYESKGTFNYVAPEILRYTNVPYSNHADIWSLGMILLQMSMIGDIPSPAFWDKTRGFDNGRNQSSILWEDFFVQCSTARPKPGREHLIYIGRKMLVEDPHARPTAEGCTLLLNNHRKTIIRPWIRLDKRRSSPITICVSALLEYGGIEFTERQRILRQISKNAAYEVTYTSAATPNLVPGLYVDHLAAMEVAKDHLSSLVGVLKQLVDEENIEKAREG